jgi:uncharacterized OB-fold protein
MKEKKEQDTRFEKFGVVSFTAITKVNDFIDYLEKGKLAGTRCKKCGKLYFPPRADCCECLSNEMEWFEVEGKGKLLSFTRLTYAPVGFEKVLPYTLGLLDFGQYKVFGWISKDIPEEELKVGMEMVPEVIRLEGDRLLYHFVKAS